MNDKEIKEVIEAAKYLGFTTYLIDELTAELTKTREKKVAQLERKLANVVAKEEAKKVTPELVRRGTQIIVPEGMNIDDAIKWMMIKKDEDERIVNVHAQFNDAFPLDALVCLDRAMKEEFGWTQTATHVNPFSGKSYAGATMINIPIDAYGKTVEVPFGEFSLPGVEGELMTGINWTGKPTLTLSGEVKNGHVPTFQKIVALTREMLLRDSIYKGHAVRVSWEWLRDVGPKGFNPLQHAPRFLDLANVDEKGLVFSRAISQSLLLGVFAPIEKSSTCRALNIPLKRGVLLEGPYGTGKTLTALVTAKKAVAHGWTFIYLDSVLDLEKGLEFASFYQPAVLFVEDIDKALTDENGERTLEMNTVLNLLDGISTKGKEIMTVFTTNFVEKLDRAVMRPGRLDTVVHLDAPDDVAAEKLVELYGGDSLAYEMDWPAVGKALAGKIPAVIREVVERAKLATIARTPDGEPLPSIETNDILDMAALMDNHIKLIEEPKKQEERPLRLVVNGIGKVNIN